MFPEIQKLWWQAVGCRCGPIAGFLSGGDGDNLARTISELGRIASGHDQPFTIGGKGQIVYRSSDISDGRADRQPFTRQILNRPRFISDGNVGALSIGRDRIDWPRYGNRLGRWTPISVPGPDSGIGPAGEKAAIGFYRNGPHGSLMTGQRLTNGSAILSIPTTNAAIVRRRN